MEWDGKEGNGRVKVKWMGVEGAWDGKERKWKRWWRRKGRGWEGIEEDW